MTRSHEINELTAALSKAQGEIKNAVKDSANPFFKSKYADLASVREAIQEPFAKHGLAVIQTTDMEEGSGAIVLVTTLTHSSGQWVAGRLPVIAKDLSNPQALGSAITYMRRYGLSAITGVAADDDDGNAAAHPNGSKEAAQKVAERKLQEIKPVSQYPAEVENLIQTMGTKRETILATVNKLFFEVMEKHGSDVANHLQASQLQKFGALNIGALNVRQYRELVLAMWQLLQEETAGLRAANDF